MLNHFKKAHCTMATDLFSQTLKCRMVLLFTNHFEYKQIIEHCLWNTEPTVLVWHHSEFRSLFQKASDSFYDDAWKLFYSLNINYYYISVGNCFQIVSVEDDGLLIVWTLIECRSGLSDNDMGLAHWGKVRLVPSSCLNVLYCFPK